MPTPSAGPRQMAPPSGGVRFAPSPTGRFHIGNLRTAWISHQLAKDLGKPWVLRFEDIDRPRVAPGAQVQQLGDLTKLGLVADLVLLQSDFAQRHHEVFQSAVVSGRAYPCTCSRREVQEALRDLASAPNDGAVAVYSGACRPSSLPGEIGHITPSAEGTIAWRFRMSNESGQDDFIIARTDTAGDFVPSYHWACAIDDFDGDYELIVRSQDLQSALKPQRAVQEWLALKGEAKTQTQPWPAAFHTSLVVQNDGHRLEKRTNGVTLDELLNYFGKSYRATEAEACSMILNIFAQSFELSVIDVVAAIKHRTQVSEARDSISLRELGF